MGERRRRSLLCWLSYRFGWVNSDGEPHYSAHVQNLTEDRWGRTRALWRHGRGWWRTPLGRFHAEWSIPSRFCHAEFTIGGGDDETLKVSVATPIAALWFDWSVSWWRPGWPRQYRIGLHDWAVHVDWGTDEFGDFRSGPGFRAAGWRRWHLDLARAVFGKVVCTNTTLKTVPTEIPTPEGVHPAQVRFFESVWRRSGWPWFPLTRRLVRAEIEMRVPVPVPGKGENSWDCGPDAIHSLTCVASTVPEAVGAMVESYMRQRERG